MGVKTGSRLCRIARDGAGLPARPPEMDAMLRILGSPKKLCNGWTRREMLRAGGLGLFGLGLNPRDPRHHPFVGSVVDFLSRKAGRVKAAEVPCNIALPFPFSSQRVGEVARAGPYAAYLGSAHNPIWTSFHGTATRKIVKILQEQRLEVLEPYVGITPDSRFELATATDLP